MDLTIKGLKVDQGGGAGSRGGKVIGRTKSGKPIYQSHGHPEHKGFTKNEHEAAAIAHAHLSIRENNSDERTRKHLSEGRKHEKKAGIRGFDFHGESENMPISPVGGSGKKHRFGKTKEHVAKIKHPE